MNPVSLVAALSIATGLIIAGLSVPLILRKVPRNHFYGIRFRASFESERNWYEINEYGGKALLVASGPITLAGLFGVIFPPKNADLYLWLDFAVTIVAVLGAFIACALKAGKLTGGVERGDQS